MEFEHGINVAAAKLRQALGDAAENPRFIETVAKRGYRFIAPIGPGPAAGYASVHEPQTTRIFGHRLILILTCTVLMITATIATLFHSGLSHQTATLHALHRITSDKGLSVDPTVSPDGTLLAYASDRSGQGNLDIWVQQLDGSSQVQLTTSEVDEHQPCFSPDGTKIAFRSERRGGGIYVIPTLGGEAKLIAGQGQNPRYSPDGRLIAYWIGPITTTVGPAGTGTVYFVPADGGSAQQLSTDLVEAGHPVWSSDGRHVMVFGVRIPPSGGAAEVDWWTVPAAGGRAKPTGIVGSTQKQGFQYAGRVYQWTKDTVLFGGMRGDPVNLWNLTLNRETTQIAGPPQRLTSGSTMEMGGNLTRDGHLIFAAAEKNYNIWSLGLNANDGTAIGKMKKLTDRSTREAHPSLSSDGRYLAYGSTRTGNRDVWVQDLYTGKETALAATSRWEEHPQISRDGMLVAYSTDLPGRASGTSAGTYVVRRSGGAPENVCEGPECGFVWDWSLDNRSLLAENASGLLTTIDTIALASRQRTTLVRGAEYDVYQGRLSPDGRWIVFAAGRGTQSRLFIAPIRDGKAVSEAEWIAIGDREGWSNKPRWSLNGGKLIYFTSRRDGYYCVWAQRVALGTVQPAEKPFNIAHFHLSHLSMMNVAEGPLEISVAKDKIVFNLSELTGNIWAGEIR